MLNGLQSSVCRFTTRCISIKVTFIYLSCQNEKFAPDLHVNWDEIEIGEVIGRETFAVMHKGSWRNDTVPLKCVNISKMLQTADQLWTLA